MDEVEKRRWSEERVPLIPVVTVGEAEVTHRSVDGYRIWGRVDISDEYDEVPEKAALVDSFESIFADDFTVEVEPGTEPRILVKGELKFPILAIRVIVRKDEQNFRDQYEKFIKDQNKK